MDEKEIGMVDHFFDKISVGMIKLSDVLKVGDKIRVKGKAADFTQDVSSMQVDRVARTEAKAGDLVSIKVEQKIRKDDKVYRVG